jgi:tetratricopeptide (TPR) repeat protein
MISSLVALLVALILLPVIFSVAVHLASSHGAWRLSRVLGHLAPYVLGSEFARALAFESEAFALREEGRITEARALVNARLLEQAVPAWSRNSAIDILISAGAYKEALAAEPPPSLPANAREALSLALIQINLAEAEYNLGRWDDAEARLRPLDLCCWAYPITRAGLLQQRAWIALHGGRASEALAMCDSIKPRWLPPTYRAEYHFTRAAALVAAGRNDEAEVALKEGEILARRLSSRRNALFLRARLAAANEDWVKVERFCRDAAEHPFRGQGGAGLLLWASALQQLGRQREADDTLRLVAERDPESEAATAAAEMLAAPHRV